MFTLFTVAAVVALAVNEQRGGTVSWDSEAHFFGSAARAMRRILVERARRVARLKHGGGRQRLSLDGLAPGEESGDSLDLLALDEALQELPEDQRSVFLLSEGEGMKYEQIAEVMDIPAGTVASRKHHAARALREDLERLGHALR